MFKTMKVLDGQIVVYFQLGSFGINKMISFVNIY